MKMFHCVDGFEVCPVLEPYELDASVSFHEVVPTIDEGDFMKIPDLA